MFDIKDDKGCFIYPGSNTYLGVVVLELNNDVYFNIDNFDHHFSAEDGSNLRIVSMDDTNISRAKKLRIETSPFKHYGDALNSISSYLTSLRIYLMKSDFSYSIPLLPKVEEIASSHDCVGIVEIELQSNARLQIYDKERFHFENRTWYRLYSKNGLPIADADCLCVESTAFTDSDEANSAINAILPELAVYLEGNLYGAYVVSGVTIRLHLSDHIRLSVDAKATLSKLISFNMELIHAYSEDNNVQSVLMLLEYKGFRDLSNLYKILEIIRSDMGEKNQSKADAKIASMSLSSIAFINSFTNTCNNDKVIGLLNARHAAKPLDPNNKNTLSFDECVNGMRNLIFNWFDYKATVDKFAEEI